MAKELIDFIASQDDNVCRYIDIHKNNTITHPIKHILKDSSRSICIHPDLYKRIQSVSNDEIIMLKNWMIATQHNTLTMINDIPSIISSNNNIRHILLRRQQEEKIEFIKYLDELAL